jgi:hypothetical protein
MTPNRGRMVSARKPFNGSGRGAFTRLAPAALALAAAALLAPPALAQTAPAAAQPIAIGDLRPAVSQVNQVATSVNIARWKAPGDVKDSTQQDLNSILRDLSSTLPGLIDKANADPTAVGPAFAVYRNIDALYDVLLRVAETATLAGSKDDSSRLQDALNQLQAARSSFGNSILQAATTRDAEVVQLRTAMAHAATAPPAAAEAPKKIVVDDGPAAKPKSTTHHKKKPAQPAQPAQGSGDSANPPKQ